MRRLMLLRHAKAERPELGRPDRERPLVTRGRDDSERIGAYMARHDLVPERALVSPSVRTRQTWEPVASALPGHTAVTFDDRLYESPAQTIFNVIREIGHDVDVLLLVGHNPALHDLARLLIASGDVDARERLNEKLPTGSLAVIDFALDDWGKLHPHSGRLDRLVTPRSLEDLTD